MEYTFTPSLTLALIDYLQVIIFAVAMFFLAKYAYRHSKKPVFILLLAGIVIATLAGVSKASWKLHYAIFDIHINILNELHMYGLALGTLCIFIAVISFTKKGNNTDKSSTMNAFPVFVVKVGVLTISTIGYLVCLIRLSARKGYKLATVAFAIYLVISLANAGLTSGREHEIFHWLAEIIGIVGNSILTIGTYTLYKREKTQL